MSDPYDREAEQLEEDFNNGHISLKEYNDGIQDIQRQYVAEQQEYAQDAYDNAMDEF